MLSEIVANFVACAFSPDTPALSEEEIVMVAPFCCIYLWSRDRVDRVSLTAA